MLSTGGVLRTRTRRWLHIGRLAVFAALLAIPCLNHADSSRSWHFDVLLDDKPIGTHRFVIHADGNNRQVESDADFRVKILFVEAYSYRHTSREHWRGNCLQEIHSETRENGDHHQVDGSTRDGLLQLVTHLPGRESDKQPSTGQTLAGCVMTFAYWNPAILKQTHLLNAQTGRHLPIRVEALGVETLRVLGRSLPTRRFAIEADQMRIDVWYADTPTQPQAWVALESRTQNGRVLQYRLRENGAK